MSRAYRICVSESVRRHVRVSDGIRTQLELIDVLPPGAMAELVAAELGRRGFRKEGERMLRVDEDGVEVSVSLAGESTGEVTVRLSRDQALDITVERSRSTDQDSEKITRAELEAEVERELLRRERDQHAELTAEVTRALEQKLRDLGQELDQVATRVTAEALKARAAQLGEIQEISEDADTGSLTIKVRV